MSLAPPEKVQKLQAALHAKAKASPNQRFHALYDKVYRSDVLGYAYACCKANGGAAGVDGRTFDDLKTYGVDRWLGELAEELKVKTYRPSPVRRVWIPKPDGKQRPLGIPTIRDRVVQTATMLVLEPLFEADLQPAAKSVLTGLLGATPFLTKVMAVALMGRPAYDLFKRNVWNYVRVRIART